MSKPWLNPLPPSHKCPVCSGLKSSLDQNCPPCSKWALSVFGKKSN